MRKRKKSMMPAKSNIITMIKKTIILATVPKQKISINLGNFYISN